MSDKKADGHSVALAVVALFAGILIGIVGAGVYSVDDSVVTTDESVEGISETQARYQITLNAHFQANALKASSAAQAVYEERSDSDLAVEALEQSSEDIATTLAVVYGDDMGDEFLDLWEGYNSSFIDYVEYARDGEQDNMLDAEVSLEEHVENTAEFLAEITELEVETLEVILMEYNQNLLQSLNAYAAGNFEESYRLQRESLAEMRSFSDVLGEGIVDTNPDHF